MSAQTEEKENKTNRERDGKYTKADGKRKAARTIGGQCELCANIRSNSQSQRDLFAILI